MLRNALKQTAITHALLFPTRSKMVCKPQHSHSLITVGSFQVINTSLRLFAKQAPKVSSNELWKRISTLHAQEEHQLVAESFEREVLQMEQTAENQVLIGNLCFLCFNSFLKLAQNDQALLVLRNFGENASFVELLEEEHFIELLKLIYAKKKVKVAKPPATVPSQRQQEPTATVLLCDELVEVLDYMTLHPTVRFTDAATIKKVLNFMIEDAVDLEAATSAGVMLSNHLITHHKRYNVQSFDTRYINVLFKCFQANKLLSQITELFESVYLRSRLFQIDADALKTFFYSITLPKHFQGMEVDETTMNRIMTVMDVAVQLNEESKIKFDSKCVTAMVLCLCSLKRPLLAIAFCEDYRKNSKQEADSLFTHDFYSMFIASLATKCGYSNPESPHIINAILTYIHEAMANSEVSVSWINNLALAYKLSGKYDNALQVLDTMELRYGVKPNGASQNLREATKAAQHHFNSNVKRSWLQRPTPLSQLAKGLQRSNTN